MQTNFETIYQRPIGIHITTRPVVIASHNGSFHADDVVGVAVLQIVFPNYQIVRTRNPQTILDADFAVDVGGIWDACTGRFDHHQKEFKGARCNGVAYASAGLVWAVYGEHCLTPLVAPLRARNIGIDIHGLVKAIDHELMEHLDRADTGASMGAPGLFGLSALVSQFNTTWLEDNGRTAEEREQHIFAQFSDAVACVKQMLKRIMLDKVSEVAASSVIRNSRREFDGRVLVLDEAGLPWINVVCNEMPDVLFVVYPDSSDKQYQVRTVPIEPESFKARADLPAAWAGLRDAQLAVKCGVPDAVFCHNGRFIGGASSLEGALRMAELALENLNR
jgi:uncharacterized UPF0160 family protein